MKKKFISIILTLLLAQPVLCFAVSSSSDTSDSSLIEDKVLLSVTNADGTESNFTANGKLLYFNEALNLIKNKEIKALEECTFNADNNKISNALVSIICDSPSTFKAYISTDKDTDTFYSDNDEINFFVPNNKAISVNLKSIDENTNCKLGILGIGINDVNDIKDEVLPMSFECAKTSAASSVASPIVKGLASLMLALFVLF